MGLRRDLGFWEVTAIAASMMLGTGIFFGPRLTAQEFPSSAAILLLWTLGGLVALAGSWVFGRLGATFPLSGGPYVYVRKAYGDFPGFLFAWTSFILIAPTGMAVLAQIFADHLSQIIPLSPLGRTLVALWSIGAATFANVIGVKTGGRVQLVLSTLKILLVAILIALLFGAGSGAPASNVEAGGRFSIAFVGILFAVGGWELAVLASEEVRDPQRTIPRALMTGAGIVVALYLLVIVSYLAVLGPGGMATSTALAPDAAERALPGSSRFVALAVAISALGTVNAIILLGPRAVFALARDGMVPPAVERVSPRWGTPIPAILLQAVITTAYLLTGTFETVASYTVLGTGVFIILSAVAFPRLVARPRSSAAWITEIAAGLLVAAVYTWFILDLLLQDTRSALIGLGLVLAGTVPFFVLHFLGYRARIPIPASVNP